MSQPRLLTITKTKGTNTRFVKFLSVGGVVMSVDVKCSVSNCYFWKDSNLCAAPAIMVTVDEQANSRFAEEIAEEIRVDLQRTDAATNSVNTCCHTFRSH